MLGAAVYKKSKQTLKEIEDEMMIQAMKEQQVRGGKLTLQREI